MNLEDTLLESIDPGLYVHIPFCTSKCNYCDFYSIVPGDAGVVERYLDALESELSGLPKDFRPRTVYMGGGTPTALPEPLLERLLACVHRTVDCSQVREWTAEANPDTLTDGRMRILQGGGVSRISLGIQTFSQEGLELMGRTHTVAAAAKACRLVRDAGIANLGIDVMYGMPGTDLETVRQDCSRIAELSPEHVSAYCLSYEAGTELERRRISGTIAELDEDLVRRQYDLVRESLSSQGYVQYEISNFAKPGFECRHNMLYWTGGSYIGCGPAAHSHWEGTRFSNCADLPEYCRALFENSSPRETEEHLPPESKARETLVMELRLLEGVDPEEFMRQTGFDPYQLCGPSVGQLLDDGLLVANGGRLRLAEKALFISDTVFRELV